MAVFGNVVQNFNRQMHFNWIYYLVWVHSDFASFHETYLNALNDVDQNEKRECWSKTWATKSLYVCIRTTKSRQIPSSKSYKKRKHIHCFVYQLRPRSKYFSTKGQNRKSPFVNLHAILYDVSSHIQHTYHKSQTIFRSESNCVVVTLFIIIFMQFLAQRKSKI